MHKKHKLESLLGSVLILLVHKSFHVAEFITRLIIVTHVVAISSFAYRPIFHVQLVMHIDLLNVRPRPTSRQNKFLNAIFLLVLIFWCQLRVKPRKASNLTPSECWQRLRSSPAWFRCRPSSNRRVGIQCTGLLVTMILSFGITRKC